jgi:hypothetical protein
MSMVLKNPRIVVRAAWAGGARGEVAVAAASSTLLGWSLSSRLSSRMASTRCVAEGIGGADAAEAVRAAAVVWRARAAAVVSRLAAWLAAWLPFGSQARTLLHSRQCHSGGRLSVVAKAARISWWLWRELTCLARMPPDTKDFGHIGQDLMAAEAVALAFFARLREFREDGLGSGREGGWEVSGREGGWEEGWDDGWEEAWSEVADEGVGEVSRDGSGVAGSKGVGVAAAAGAVPVGWLAV